MNDRIKKLLMSVAALAALAVGGSALAGAQGNGQSGGSPAASTLPAEQPGSDAAETGEKADGPETGAKADGPENGDASDQVSGADAANAKAAALAEVGSGKATEVSAENHAGDKAEAPDPGDKADPAYEAQIAYDVEVTKADGSVVDVHLDKAFKVLGTEAGHQDKGGDHADGAEQSGAAQSGAAQ